MPKTIEISHRTVIFTIAFLGLIWLMIQITSIILTLFVAILIMTALNPIVDRLTWLKVPRPLAIVLVYIVMIGGFIAGLSSILPPLVDQTTSLANRIPLLYEQLNDWMKSVGISGIDKDTLSSQITQLGAIPANIVFLLITIFSNIISVFTVLVISFYLLLERQNLNKYLLVLFGQGGEKEAKNFVDRLEVRLGGWVRGQLILMTIIGFVTYIGLWLLGIPYALPLAILAGLLEIIPTIGPIVASFPAVIIAMTISPVMAIAVAALYFLINQLENTLILPKVMERVTGVNPLVSIISLAIGLKLAGVLGAILAVPIVIVLHVVAVEVLSIKRLSSSNS